MPIGTFRLPALTVVFDDGRVVEGLVYAPLGGGEIRTGATKLFVAVGRPGRPDAPDWLDPMLNDGPVTVRLVGYPRESWRATVHIAEGDERAQAWADIKQARLDLTASWDAPDVTVVVFDLTPMTPVDPSTG